MTEREAATREEVDVVVVGAGPAGASAALNLARQGHRTLVLDSNRPRHAATLRSHGFLTRDGIAPNELRAMARDEIAAYENASVEFARVTRLYSRLDGVALQAEGMRGAPNRHLTARAVVLATGLTEILPALPSIRVYYGTALHSCMMCDGYEKRGQRLVLIGETPDLARHATFLSQWSGDVWALTNGSGAIDQSADAGLAERGISVDRRPIDDLAGERATLTGVRFVDGDVLEVSAGFIRPHYRLNLAFASELDFELGPRGYLAVNMDGGTTIPGVFAAGDITEPGPRQLLVAAGQGVVAATGVGKYLLGLSPGAPSNRAHSVG